MRPIIIQTWSNSWRIELKMWQLSKQSNSKHKPWFHQVLNDRFIDWKQSKNFKHAIAEKTEHPFKLAALSLEPKEKAAFILHYQQFFSWDQVADILGLSKEESHNVAERLKHKCFKTQRLD